MRDVIALPLGCCVFTVLFIVIIRAPEVLIVRYLYYRKHMMLTTGEHVYTVSAC